MDRALGRRMGERAKKTANLYSWDKIAEQTLTLYRQVVGTERS